MIASPKSDNFRGIICGTSGRDIGAWPQEKVKILKNFGLSLKSLVMGEQIHEDKIVVATEKKIYPKTDGLITVKPGIFLGVKTSDCAPVVFWEKKKNIVGIVHAGWRGTLLRITKKMIQKIKKLRGNPKNIFLWVGPHIQKCCYDIDIKRAGLFREVFKSKEKGIKRKNGRIFLDLSYFNIQDALASGVPLKNIEVFPICTFCSKDFFSFRRKDKGEMLTLVGYE